MEQTTNPYLRTRIMSASPQELRLMLLDGAIKFTRQAQDGLRRKDFELSYNGFSQARAIVMELVEGIRDDADPDLAAKVRGVFLFLYRELMDASFNKNADKLDKVLEILEYERETWVLAMEKIAAERGTRPPGRDAGEPSIAAGSTSPARPGEAQNTPRTPTPGLGFNISA